MVLPLPGDSSLNWNLEMLVFGERAKSELTRSRVPGGKPFAVKERTHRHGVLAGI